MRTNASVNWILFLLFVIKLFMAKIPGSTSGTNRDINIPKFKMLT